MGKVARLNNNGSFNISGELMEFDAVTNDVFVFSDEPLGTFDKFKKFLHPSTGWEIVEKEIEVSKGIERVLENYFNENLVYNGYGIGYMLDEQVDYINMYATLAVGHHGGLALMQGNTGYISSIKGLLYNNNGINRSDQWETIGSFSANVLNNRWYKTRMYWDIEGNIKIKVWDEGDSEPDSWGLETTDNAIIPTMVGVVFWRRGFYGWVKDFTVKYPSSVPVRINSNGNLIAGEFIESQRFIVKNGIIELIELIEGGV